MFVTGFISGSQYVRLLAQLATGDTPPAIVSVGKVDDGSIEVEVFAAPGAGSVELHDAAYDHVVERGYGHAAIVCADAESIALFVLAPGAPDQMVLRVTELVEVDGTQIKTSEPEILVAGDDVDVEAFLEGFQDAIAAEALSFTLERAPSDRSRTTTTPTPIRACSRPGRSRAGCSPRTYSISPTACCRSIPRAAAPSANEAKTSSASCTSRKA